MDNAQESSQGRNPQPAHSPQRANPPEEVWKRFEEAYYNYVRALREAWVPEDVRRRFEEAYRNYVRALKEGWAQVDISTVDVDTMAMISQSMMTAIRYAWATLPRASRGTA